MYSNSFLSCCRYTLNSWKSYADVQATYVANSCDGFSDKFSFVIYAHSLSVGQRLELACRFQCKGCQYWDNNNGRNTAFSAYLSSTIPPRHLSRLVWTGAIQPAFTRIVLLEDPSYTCMVAKYQI
ncbi:unnamed protein product [Acanthoscelides obtectus]|uniref:CBM21 domain-containing protein n=1 Tax=Acanthoscelides obtectus TaxID=200917 RepID=A0A9P0Q5V1_ACAOB|nr:unnamed protein product [Acanthoscelides obtectus]CAK1647559.1 Glycogen-binding subunit 76A [Acanthoscelides obtectus]